MNGLRCVLVLLCILAFNSCSKDSDEDHLIDVQKDFELFLIEELDVEGNKLLLGIKTVEKQECQNTSLVVPRTITTDSLTIQVNVEGILQPSNCIEPGYFAFEFVPIDIVSDMGLTLDFWLRDEVQSKGKFEAKELSYSLEFEEEIGFSLLQTTLWRVPDSIAWGSIFYENIGEDVQFEVERLLDDMEESLFALDMIDGYYGHFEIVMGRFKNASIGMGSDAKHDFGVYLGNGNIVEWESRFAEFREFYPEVDFVGQSWLGEGL